MVSLHHESGEKRVFRLDQGNEVLWEGVLQRGCEKELIYYLVYSTVGK